VRALPRREDRKDLLMNLLHATGHIAKLTLGNVLARLPQVEISETLQVHTHIDQLLYDHKRQIPSSTLRVAFLGLACAVGFDHVTTTTAVC